MTTETVSATNTLEPARGRLPVRRADLGLVAAVVTAAAFGTSGPFAKALLTTGWSSGAIVLLRVGIAALVLAVPAVLACRGRWSVVGPTSGGSRSSASSPSPAARWPTSTPWARSPSESRCCWSTPGRSSSSSCGCAAARRRAGSPSWGVVLALAGLGLVLDIVRRVRPSLVGVMWGLAAAVGLAATSWRPRTRPAAGRPGLASGWAWAPWSSAQPVCSARPHGVSSAEVLIGDLRVGVVGRRRRAGAGRRSLRLPARSPGCPRARGDRGVVRRAERGSLRHPLRLAPARRAARPHPARRRCGHRGGVVAVRLGERERSARRVGRPPTTPDFPFPRPSPTLLRVASARDAARPPVVARP